jgi:uncharacterized protein YifE (UPF0438 family)
MKAIYYDDSLVVDEMIDEYELHFLSVMSGEEKPNLFTESAWLKFRADFPGLAAEIP